MKKILIVEDELSYLKLLHDQLAQKGYEVFQASDGKKGLSLAKSKKPDLILLDIRMPVLNGLSMLYELRKSEQGKEAKVIILTNLEPDDKIIKKVLEGKPELYLIKSDIKLADLMDKLEKALN